MRFAITFGQKYSHEEHKLLPGVTHLSFMTVFADDEMAARIDLGETIDNSYAFLYEFDEEFEKQIRKYNLTELPYYLKDGALIDGEESHTT